MAMTIPVTARLSDATLIEPWASRVSADPVAARRNAINIGLGLVNWLILLLLMCALLLAKTLPAGSSDLLGGVSSVTCNAKTCTKVQPVR